ncbi:uncharacterized protein LOC134705371 [Mytilus trossulus]|uniref:uncharacterized protein LOC134705371 n=1 Tax=Mytilus trossulus TaxID=6551 RepID=UPI0030043DCE
MFRIMVVISSVLIFPLVMAYDMKFGYQISEGNARFIEDIETNLGTNIVKIHTPAHNNVMESYLMQDFQRSLQITCLPSLNHCRLREIDSEIGVDAGKISEAFVYSWNKGINSISKSTSRVVTELYYVDGDEVTDTVSLGEDLRQFYQGFGYKLYLEKKIPQDAKILNITRPTGKRVKRMTTLNFDCGDDGIQILYGLDEGTNCNYLKICKEAVVRNGQAILTDCGDIHITSPMVYKCLCCAGVTEINLGADNCRCNEMKQDRVLGHATLTE